eukprot:TRINITY_DN5108_c0_g4_i1.p1 TRINITY_DN5108_c0_g4~~TRINITY_DN5108_c0_g4_i1.p1  ORF type:complete len:380 (+),score=85.30 TRINITY_DN5108_c0_g4_i1:39-1178(+)
MCIRDRSLRNAKGIEWNSIGFNVNRGDKFGIPKFADASHFLEKSGYEGEMDHSEEFSLSQLLDVALEGGSIVITPSLYDAGQKGEFFLQVFADAEILRNIMLVEVDYAKAVQALQKEQIVQAAKDDTEGEEQEEGYAKDDIIDLASNEAESTNSTPQVDQTSGDEPSPDKKTEIPEPADAELVETVQPTQAQPPKLEQVCCPQCMCVFKPAVAGASEAVVITPSEKFIYDTKQDAKADAVTPNQEPDSKQPVVNAETSTVAAPEPKLSPPPVPTGDAPPLPSISVSAPLKQTDLKRLFKKNQPEEAKPNAERSERSNILSQICFGVTLKSANSRVLNPKPETANKWNVPFDVDRIVRARRLAMEISDDEEDDEWGGEWD